MQRYSVGGRCATTGATNGVACALWNPSSSRVLYVEEIWIFKTTASFGDPTIQRITTRGTSTLTVTPDIDNDWERLAAPPSGALLDLTYSAQPTKQSPMLGKFRDAGVTGSQGLGVSFIFTRPVRVIGGEGLCVTGTADTVQASDVTFIWRE